jgi:phage tail-like protein
MTHELTTAGVSTFLPAVLPGPPHDPTWFLLNGRTGWRTVSVQNIDVLSTLTLATPPGSFDSVLRLPYVAQGPDCSIFLLDREHKLIKRYDPCCCTFDTVPCIGPFVSPTAIAICSGNLFVCDPGAHRLSIYSLAGFVRRGALNPPNQTHPWEPTAIDFDGRGTAYVADPANNRVHLFAPNGRWLRGIIFAGLPNLVAIDCADRLYIRLQGENLLHILDSQDHEIGTVDKPAQLAGLFPCKPDLPAGVGSTVPAPTFAPTGTWLTVLDSRLYRCQWHRILISADVPRGSHLLVSTYTTEADVSANQIPDLPESVWNTNQPARTNPAWDCLVRSGGGRYLWLRLQFTGNGAVTPTVSTMRIEYPRISLRRYLPSVFAQDPSATDFTDRFLALFDTTFRSIESELDSQARYFDPASAPATAPRGQLDFLTWLASWVGLKLGRGIPEDRRRALVEGAGRVAPIRGTRIGLHRQLLALLGMTPKVAGCCCGGPVCSCTPQPLNCRPAPPLVCAWQPPPLILEHFQLRRWLYVGAGRLGDESVLWGERLVGRAHLDHDAQIGASLLITTPDPYRDPFHHYAHKFTVFVPVRFGEDPGFERALLNLLEAESPAHTKHYLQFVGPRFRIGFQSTIGLDSVVGRYPRGVELGATPLGSASVLDSPPNRRGGPTLEVGVAARIGATTKLS